MDIRSRRYQLNLTIKSASKKAGLLETTWRKIERGLIDPSEEQKKCIQKILGEFETNNYGGKISKLVLGEGYQTNKNRENLEFQPKFWKRENNLNVIDLFCGAGGLSEGFKKNKNFQVSFGLDLLPDRARSFNLNNPNAFSFCNDLRQISFKKLKEMVGEVDVILGGPPCQGFSSIRPFRTLTEQDQRNTLPENYLIAVAELKPSWVIFENVVGILSNKNGNTFQNLVKGLKELDYFVDYKVINSAELGVPQNRERVFVIGRKNGQVFKWMKPKYLVSSNSMVKRNFPSLTMDSLSEDLKMPITLRDAIEDLPSIRAGEESRIYQNKNLSNYQKQMRGFSKKLSLHYATKHSDKMLEIIKLSGKNIYSLPQGLIKSGYSSCYSRLDYDKPSTTLTVNFVHPSSNRCIHPVQHRALTPREGARIQSFQDDFIFYGSKSQIVKQIGNAVPPILSEHLAEMIANNL